MARRVRRCAAVAALLAAILPLAAAAATGDKTLAPGTRFLVPLPSDGAVQQGLSLLAHHDVRGALLIAKMETVPRSVWLTGGTAGAVTKQVRQALLLADAERAVPTFVVYNIPGRDCGSAPGARR